MTLLVLTLEVVFLALVNAVRPTSLAAVYALLAAPSPRRLMTVYVASGLAFTIGFGLLVIWAFNGVDIDAGSSRTVGVADLAAGLLTLAFAIAVLTGRVGGRHPDDLPRTSRRSRWDAMLDQRLTVRTAMIAGPITHVPGLFYLLALNLIVAGDRAVVSSFVEVLAYNAIWFVIPIGALAVCVVDPERARAAIGAIQTLIKRHARTVILVVLFAVAALLIGRGLIALV